MKTTNYFNTFIEVAEDCPRDKGEEPPLRDGNKTKARFQYEILSENPYRYTSDDLIFTVHAIRNDIPQEERAEAREDFFSKGRACLRSSSLGKRYGWGFHFDKDGKAAIYRVESDQYQKFINDESLDHLKAMRSSRK